MRNEIKRVFCPILVVPEGEDNIRRRVMLREMMMDCSDKLTVVVISQLQYSYDDRDIAMRRHSES